jgi:hypothetical protein
LAAKHGQPLLPGFNRGFVDPIELEEFAVILADLLFDVAIPEVSSEAVRAVFLFVPRQQNLWVNSSGSGSRPNV